MIRHVTATARLMRRLLIVWAIAYTLADVAGGTVLR